MTEQYKPPDKPPDSEETANANGPPTWQEHLWEQSYGSGAEADPQTAPPPPEEPQEPQEEPV